MGEFAEVILPGGVLGIRFIFTGREGNHAIERSYVHRSQLQLSWNGLSPLCSHGITGLLKMASILPRSNDHTRSELGCRWYFNSIDSSSVLVR